MYYNYDTKNALYLKMGNIVAMVTGATSAILHRLALKVTCIIWDTRHLVAKLTISKNTTFTKTFDTSVWKDHWTMCKWKFTFVIRTATLFSAPLYLLFPMISWMSSDYILRNGCHFHWIWKFTANGERNISTSKNGFIDILLGAVLMRELLVVYVTCWPHNVLEMILCKWLILTVDAMELCRYHK
jgi:hypothetical protein